MPKISQYPTKTTFHNEDLLDMSNTDDAGLTYDESQKVTWANFVVALNAVIENFASHDLTLPKNRIHDLASFEVAFINGPMIIGGVTAPAPVIFELRSTTQGFLKPRMTTEQRDLITPVEGLEIYNLTTKKMNFYNGSDWEQITSV